MINRREFLKISAIIAVSYGLKFPIFAETMKTENYSFCLPYCVPKSDIPPPPDPVSHKQYLPVIRS